MFSIKNTFVIKADDCVPTRIEFINFVQSYCFYKESKIFANKEGFVQYFLKLSSNIEVAIKYFVVFILFRKEPLMSDTVDCYRNELIKLISKDALKGLINEISINNSAVLAKFVNDYQNYLDCKIS